MLDPLSTFLPGVAINGSEGWKNYKNIMSEGKVGTSAKRNVLKSTIMLL